MQTNAISAPPELFSPLTEMRDLISKSGLEEDLVNLINVRVSQLNGCAYCVDKHVNEALDVGEEKRRLLLIGSNHSLFSSRERAALAWAEALTLLSDRVVSDGIKRQLSKHFNEGEIASLTFAIACINAWNRIGVGFQLKDAEQLN